MGEKSMENGDRPLGDSDLKPVNKMTAKEMEAELKERGIPQPGRWFWYKPEKKEGFLEKVRSGKITAESLQQEEHKSPYDAPGIREVFRNKSKSHESEK